MPWTPWRWPSIHFATTRHVIREPNSMNTHLERTLRIIGAVFPHEMSDRVDHGGRCARKRVPARCQHGGDTEGVRAERAQEFHGEDLAERGARKTHAGEREILLCLGEKVGADDKTCVHHCEVVELRVFEDKRPDDGKVNVGRGQLAEVNSGCARRSWKVSRLTPTSRQSLEKGLCERQEGIKCTEAHQCPSNESRDAI